MRSLSNFRTTLSPKPALEKLYNDAQRIREKTAKLGEEIYSKISPFSPSLIAK